MNGLVKKSLGVSCVDILNKQLEIGQVCIVSNSWFNMVKCRLVDYSVTSLKFEIIQHKYIQRVGFTFWKRQSNSERDVFILEDLKD